MAKRMIVMLILTGALVAGLGFVKFRQFQAAAGQAAAFQPPPEAVTTIVAVKETWPASLSAIGTIAPVQGVTVSADLPGTVDRIAFDSGAAVVEGDVLVELDTRQERAQLAAVEAQLTAMRARYSDADPKTSEMRNLRNALERQLNSVRSMRGATTRPGVIRGRSATPSATSGAEPKVNATTAVTTSSF